MKAQKISFILILFILLVTSGKGQQPAVIPSATPEVTPPIGKDKPAAATQEVAPAKKEKSEKPLKKNQTGDIEALIEAAKVEAKKGWDAEMAPKLKALEDAKKTAEAALAALQNKAPEVDKKQSDADKKAIEEAQTAAKTAQIAANDAQKALSQKEIELRAKTNEVRTLQKRSDDLEQDLAKIKKVAKEKGNLEAAIAEAEKKIGASKEQMKDIQMQKEAAEKQAKVAEEQAKESGKKADDALAQKAIAEGQKAIAEKKTMIAIGAGLLLTLLITLIGGSYYVKQLKQKSDDILLGNQNLAAKNIELEREKKEKEELYGEVQNVKEVLEISKSELLKKKLEQGNIEGIIEDLKGKGRELGLIVPQLDKKNYFFAETMTSAGPRKSEEGGLGEDVTGMLVREDFACFWIFDGVSDNHILKNETGEYFSSRLLAQSIAWAMQIQLSTINHIRFDLKMAFEKACEMALDSIQEKINKLTSAEKTNLITDIRNRDIPTIATTALVGLLSKQGDLKMYRIGVDKVIVLSEGKLIDPKKDGTPVDRIAFALDLDKSGQLVVKAVNINERAQYAQDFKDVTTVIGATDGISNTLLNWLKGQKQLNFMDPTVRKMVANNRDKTGDDKALCIIQIKSIA